jgi:hypothetical protein
MDDTSNAKANVKKRALMSAAWSMRFDLLIYAYLLFEVYFQGDDNPPGSLGGLLAAVVWIGPPFMLVHFASAYRKHLAAFQSESRDRSTP